MLILVGWAVNNARHAHPASCRCFPRVSEQSPLLPRLELDGTSLLPFSATSIRSLRG